MKHGFGKLAGLSEAMQIILDIVGEKNSEKISLGGSLHRVLAEDVKSPIDVPHFRKSAMDGFAVRAEDTFGCSNNNPKNLAVIESVIAGIIPEKELRAGECTEITTGAPLPDEADAVLMVEYTEKEGNQIKCYRAVAPGDNVITVGSDVKKGTVIFRKGTLLNPRFLGVLSSMGIGRVVVKEKPRIAYFSSGNEITGLDEKLGPGRIYDINSYTILNAIWELNCEAINLGIALDTKEEVVQKIREGVKKADFVLMSGGSSLGGEDYMVEAVDELGEVLVHGIAVKPGKPVLVGKVEGMLVLGLPGYPASALSNFYILVKPIIEKMLGTKFIQYSTEARLSRKIASTIGRYEFLPVKLVGDEAVPVMKGSSAITTLAESDGYIEISENTEVIEKGGKVLVKFF